MNFDVLTLAAVRAEIEARALGGRVQRTASPAPAALTLEVYSAQARHRLLLSVDPNRPRAMFVSQWPPARFDPASPLLLLARRWIRGARLVAVEQPAGERILDLTFELHAPDTAAPARNRLILEVIGRQTNLLLVDEHGRIREAERRVRGGPGRRRLQPGARYERPPPPDLPDLARLDPRVLRNGASGGAMAWRTLVGNVRAVSPTLAREALARAGNRPDAACREVANWAEVLRRLAEILADAANGVWRPTLAPAGDGWAGFAPYVLTQFDAAAVPAASMSQALERFDAAAAAAAPARAPDAQAERVRRLIDAAVERVERRLASLRSELASSAAAADLQSAGETLLAFAQGLPTGAAQFQHDGRTIPLDPRRSAVDNAQTYFARARSRRAAARRVPSQLRRADLDLEFLRQAAHDLARAESPSVVRALEAALADAGHAPSTGKRRAPAAPSAPPRWLLHGHQLRAGRTAAENHRLTFHSAAPDDLWLHARNVPGAHVILATSAGAPPDEVVEHAAGIAAWCSAARNDARVDVDVTRRRNVRPIRGAGPGQVTYRAERTLRVPPRPPPATDE